MILRQLLRFTFSILHFTLISYFSFTNISKLLIDKLLKITNCKLLIATPRGGA